jgi:hypothetical protein
MRADEQANQAISAPSDHVRTKYPDAVDDLAEEEVFKLNVSDAPH